MQAFSKYIRTISLSVLVLSGAIIPAFAAGPDTVQLDSLLLRLSRHHKMMGSLAVMEDGNLVYNRAVGLAQPGTPATPESRYRIGSISKTFTAVIIMQLVEEGKLKLDTKLAKFYPKMPNAKLITVEMLLRHRSGLGSFTDRADYMLWNTLAKKPAELLDIMQKEKTVFAPDSSARYSNTNYVLLGWIAEKVTKKPMALLIEERISKKAGLTHTTFGGALDTGKGDVQSFRRVKQEWTVFSPTDMSIPLGAGAVVSTSADVARFYNALFSGKLLKAGTVAQMTTLKDGFGMGLFRIPFGEDFAWGHNGGIDGFVSNAAFFPSKKMSIALLTNGLDDVPMNDMLIGAISLSFGVPYTLPEFGKPAYVVEEAVLNRYAGLYSAPGFPLKLNIFVKEGKLFGQGTGQGAFPLTPLSDTEFEFVRAGIKVTFGMQDGKPSLTILQAGRATVMTRE
jgi:CubicO group peptidase (beta-lactamase class C family)